ncbi:MAG TPA: hypothetical protein VFN03_11590 [Trueperaceae bacterium]|nr:hypothetical protein [Trueperaceae bacterium]
MQATANVGKTSWAERLRWNDVIAPWLVRLVFLALGLLVGLYFLAPRQQRALDTYLPPAYASLPNGVVSFVGADGAVALPVSIADTTGARNLGFAGVGNAALDNQLLLYVLTRETTARTTYSTTGAAAGLQYAAINQAGEVVSITDAPLGTLRVTVAEPHRWILAARTGMLGALGVEVGSAIDPEGVVKVNY